MAKRRHHHRYPALNHAEDIDHTNSFYRRCGPGDGTGGKLHQQYPEAKIDFLLRKGNEGLLDHHPFLHEVLIWDKQQAKRKTCSAPSQNPRHPL